MANFTVRRSCKTEDRRKEQVARPKSKSELAAHEVFPAELSYKFGKAGLLDEEKT